MQNNYDEILVVHLGGLGDICLAESIFLSLRRHFGNCLTALGNRRFLDLFSTYFTKTYGIESRHWLYLFSEKLTGPCWKRIVFVGKDRQTIIRKRWAPYSREELIFIDMYPEGSFPDQEKTITVAPHENIHIEEFQLRQLASFGIAPVRAEIIPKNPDRVVLYPERGFTKEKWAPENFVALADLLKKSEISVRLLKPADLDLPGEALVIDGLAEVKEFFGEGGIFVSNDSGMAHFAAACGLPTITVFTDFDPVIWHPRGRNASLKQGVDSVDISSIFKIVQNLVSRKL